MKNELIQHYDQQAGWDPAYFDWKISRYRANKVIMHSFDWVDWKGKRVLDIGCGQGYYAIPIAGRCAQVVGLDLSSANIEIASKHAVRLGLNNTQFHNTDLFDFTPDEQFDVAYAITVLMHIPDLQRAMEKVATLLKPGGKFLISDLNRYFHTQLIPFRRKAPFFFRTFSFRELRTSLEQSGFRVLQESGRLYSLGGRRQPEWMVFLSLEKWAKYFPIKHFGEHIAVLAEKK